MGNAGSRHFGSSSFTQKSSLPISCHGLFHKVGKGHTSIPVPLHHQTAALVTKVIIKICNTFGVPSILHSDQGHNFESDILR